VLLVPRHCIHLCRYDKKRNETILLPLAVPEHCRVMQYAGLEAHTGDKKGNENHPLTFSCPWTWPCDVACGAWSTHRDDRLTKGEKRMGECGAPEALISCASAKALCCRDRGALRVVKSSIWPVLTQSFFAITYNAAPSHLWTHARKPNSCQLDE
jgi:hypothetical protein